MSTPPSNGDRPVVIAVNAAGVAALVLGIVALIGAFLPVIGIVLGILFGLAGLVAGIIGRRQAADDTDPRRQNLGIATGGIVASSIALAIAVVQIVGIVTLTGLETTQFDEYVDSLGNRVPAIDIDTSGG